MELSEVGLLYKQAGSNEYFMSKNLQKMLGFETQTVSTQQFREKIHANDQAVFDSHCINYEERSYDDNHKITSMELRLSFV